MVATDVDRQQLLLERLVEQKQRRFEETRVAGFADNPRNLTFLRRATTLLRTASLRSASTSTKLIGSTKVYGTSRAVDSIFLAFVMPIWASRDRILWA